jgi:N-acetyl-anhydromuramyl-L-alanine amidase AmpD
MRAFWRSLPPHRRPLVGTALLGMALALAGMGWVVAGGGSSTSRKGPSLLELLEQVGKPEPEDIPATPAPQPPPHPPWRSPLRRQCGGVDVSIRRRLERLRDDRAALTRTVPIDPSNYGERHAVDAYGNPLDTTPRVVVLHETVFGLESAVNTFLTHHPRDEDQVSYHTLIGENGTIVSLVDPSRRAYGAGNSAFDGEWAITNRDLRGSVNNFSLHVSLETPIDGEDAAAGHSGYSSAQYDALAVVLDDWMERFGFPPRAVTTHEAVDLGGERADPRSFDWGALQVRLAALGRLCGP